MSGLVSQRAVWRIVEERFAGEAYSGEGARLYGGRWGSAGVPVAYAAGSYSLALLETLVRMNKRRRLSTYYAVPATFDDELVEGLEEEALPENWKAYPEPEETRRLGDDWVASGRSLALSVPSVVVPRERNYLLNPRHPDFGGGVAVGEPERVVFDARLL